MSPFPVLTQWYHVGNEPCGSALPKLLVVTQTFDCLNLLLCSQQVPVVGGVPRPISVPKRRIIVSTQMQTDQKLDPQAADGKVCSQVPLEKKTGRQAYLPTPSMLSLGVQLLHPLTTVSLIHYCGTCGYSPIDYQSQVIQGPVLQVAAEKAWTPDVCTSSIPGDTGNWILLLEQARQEESRRGACWLPWSLGKISAILWMPAKL